MPGPSPDKAVQSGWPWVGLRWAGRGGEVGHRRAGKEKGRGTESPGTEGGNGLGAGIQIQSQITLCVWDCVFGVCTELSGLAFLWRRESACLPGVPTATPKQESATWRPPVSAGGGETPLRQEWHITVSRPPWATRGGHASGASSVQGAVCVSRPHVARTCLRTPLSYSG